MSVVIATLVLAVGASAVPPRWAVAILPSGREFSLEVAADPESRARGYMFREAIAPNEGMIFVFDHSERHGFWMKNCRTSLDIVWLDASFRVVHIAGSQPPCPDGGACPSVEPAQPARFVIEFAAGTAAVEGLRVGDAVAVLSDPPLR